MRKGVLDIGSNTIKFKIFEKNELLLFKVYPVQLGTGLNDNQLSKEMIERLQNCFKEVESELNQYEAKLSRVIGTSALRDAENSEVVTIFLRDLFQKELEIIPGDQEAELIYLGVRKGIQTDGNYLICDIGGGSVELIYCSNDRLIKAHSFEVGVIKLFKLRKNADPYSKEDILFYSDYLNQEFSAFLEEVDTDYLVGAAGSFESIYALLNDKDYSGAFENIEIEDLNQVIDGIIKSSQKERDENQLLPMERKILLPLGAILVKYLINNLEINKFTVSPNSLIEGLEL